MTANLNYSSVNLKELAHLNWFQSTEISNSGSPKFIILPNAEK